MKYIWMHINEGVEGDCFSLLKKFLQDIHLPMNAFPSLNFFSGETFSSGCWAPEYRNEGGVLPQNLKT